MHTTPQTFFSNDSLPYSLEVGKLSIYHLKRFWAKSLQKRHKNNNQYDSEVNLDKALIDCLGLGLSSTISYLFQQNPTFDEFEDWIIENGNFDPNHEMVQRFNHLFEETDSELELSSYNSVLSKEEKEFFDSYGYLVIKNAVDKEQCLNTVKAISEFIGDDVNNPETWYKDHSSKHGIMIEFFNVS